ncbi:MAG: hypothetical protein L3J87_02685 [Thermoplasmata archaeon]|nr:hypothetical protein [Thermoplasmata archaeon]
MADEPDAPVPTAGAISLSGPERRLLEALRGPNRTAVGEEELAKETGLAADQVRGSLQRL